MRKKKFNIFNVFGIGCTIFFALALFLGALAGVVDPKENFILPFFGLAFPFIFLLNCFLLIILFIKKRWLSIALIIMVMVYARQPINSTFGFFGDQGDIFPVEKSIRVLTYNVHSFKTYGDNNNNDVKDQMLKVIKEQNADVICFQEYFTRFKGPYNTLDAIKDMGFKYVYFKTTSKNEFEAHGMAIFSKFPIVNSGVIDFDKSLTDNKCIYADIEVENKNIRVFNAHLQSISFQKQDYDYIDSVKDMKTDFKPTKRIAKMLKNAFDLRSGQVNILKKEMESSNIPYFITGDFNDTPASFAVTQITKNLNNAFLEKGKGFGKTYNGKFPNFQIDYIVASKDFSVENYKIIESKLSDHFPVRSDLKLLN